MRYRIGWVVFGLALGVAASLSPVIAFSAGAADARQYPVTIEALEERYQDEIQAQREYGAYAEQAGQEGYPQIANLFTALAASEAVHARNFEASLVDLGVEIEAPVVEVELTTTREHLQQATKVETQEIDREYPHILERVKPEDHTRAIRDLTYAWEAEKQHRDLIVKIHKAASRWFGLLVSRIEGESTHYYVCEVCGSTLTEVPEAQCPICEHSIGHYREILGVPAEQPVPQL